MAQNDWQFNVSSLNTTPTEGASQLHSALTDPIPESANAGQYCRRWRFYDGSTTWTGCFIRSKKEELINIPDTRAISISAWVRWDNNDRSTNCGIFIKATSDSYNPTAYSFFARENNTLNLYGSTYNAPSGVVVNRYNWVHLRMDVVPIKHNDVVIMDNLKGYVEVNGSWVLVGERFIEATDSNFISWSGTRYNGVFHRYYAPGTSDFYVDKIKIYTESLEQPEQVFLSLVNDTGVSDTDNITSDATLQLLSTLETGSILQYSLNGYNWQNSVPSLVSGSYSIYARQRSASGVGSKPTKLDIVYAPTGPVFTSEATGSAYDGRSSGSVVYKAAVASVTDVSFSLKQVDDFADFSINSGSGEVSTLIDLTSSVQDAYNFTIVADDLAGNSSEFPVLLNLINTLDPYIDNVSLLLKMDNDFSDSSQYNHQITVSGNAQINTLIKKYGNGSGYFDGDGDVLYINGDASLTIGTNDFTIEMWAYFPILRNYMPLIETNNYTNGILWRVMGDGSIGMWFANSTGPFCPAGTVSTNQWYHLALTRTNGIARVFVNGVLIASNTNTQDVTAGTIRIGQSAHATGEYLNAYLDDYRITIGVARYTSNFTPPDSIR